MLRSERVPMKPSAPLVLAQYKPSMIAEQLIMSEHECFVSGRRSGGGFWLRA